MLRFCHHEITIWRRCASATQAVYVFSHTRSHRHVNKHTCRHGNRRIFTTATSHHPVTLTGSNSVNTPVDLPRPSAGPVERRSSLTSSQEVIFIRDIDKDGLLIVHETETERENQQMKDKEDTAGNKSPCTPLTQHLHEQIDVTGPLSLYDYQQQCMQNSTHGYYMTKRNIIGGKEKQQQVQAHTDAQTKTVEPITGDFITSPEISQLFGEMVGVWLVSIWEKMNKPAQMHIVELGPGRGTLSKDILRVTQ